MINSNCGSLARILNRQPDAAAIIKGSTAYPGIKGKISFYRVLNGVIVCTEVYGLPMVKQTCKNPIFAFHIHSGGNCSGNKADEFANVNGHFNPQNTPHPCHAGDMPPLFYAGGIAFSAFLTNRFTLPEIIGRTVIIHDMPDDFTTQPSGNAGEKMACGIIYQLKERG